MESTKYSSAKKMADEFMALAMGEKWEDTPGSTEARDAALKAASEGTATSKAPSNIPTWVKDAARAMNELSPEACMVHIIRLTDLSNNPGLANLGDDPKASKQALLKFNLALATCEDFTSAMKKLHEEKAKHADDPAWMKQLHEATR